MALLWEEEEEGTFLNNTPVKLQLEIKFILTKSQHSGGRGRQIWELEVHDLCSEFEASEGYIVRSYLKN